MKEILKNIIIVTLGITIGFSICYIMDRKSKTKTHDIVIHKNIDKDLPPSLRVYYWINYYSDSLDIPVEYLYGIANTESAWQGPLDFTYKPNVKSSAGALGPMQIMPSTAKWILGKPITSKLLANDIQLNVMISAVLVKKLYDKNKDWMLVFGEYNTGKSIINSYSNKVYNYEPNWGDSVIVNLNN
jgi:soluble lytic murein transglycosylase-like protein